MSRLFLTPLSTTALGLCVLALSACGGRSDRSDTADKAGTPQARVEVTEAWCRPTPNGAETGACYMTLKADGAPEALMGVASPAAASVQIHRMSTEAGQMRMEPMDGGLALPVGQSVSLAPGQNHIMLMNLTRPLVVGESVSLTLGFQRIAPMTVQAEVRLPQVESGAAARAKK